MQQATDGNGSRVHADTGPAVPGQQPHRIDIYVSRYCGNCAHAPEVAELIRREYPAIPVHLIDLAEPQAVAPDNVFATPTYLLDGQRWSLGNPSPQQVRDLLGKLE